MKTYFKYLLTPYDAQRGFMVVLHNVNFEQASGCNQLLCHYGATRNTDTKITTGSYNFRLGLTAGIRINNITNIIPVQEMIT